MSSLPAGAASGVARSSIFGELVESRKFDPFALVGLVAIASVSAALDAVVRA